ncbi:MAG: response regulator [Campylobacteraceae bacterium]|jgi:two-component system chemotaxis response regulator CheY|nr:response regulator [Campylobacteraceae bacterium]MBT5491490.1 response regulator [bacterium]MBT3882388.1 response regulator [Campylobacteraceae bacterium]MBT4030307.1 response regulator [Campylobacteraceae bacterium]MBT4179479.1 response regulator [Campylobacteraceae bacterium]
MYNKNILLVDDSQILLDLLIHALKDSGLDNIDTAVNGKEALEMSIKNNYNLIITDINMPKIDGFKLISKLKELDKYKNIPVLVLSVLSDEESKQKAKSNGAVGWITKPFLPTQLVKAVNLCLSKGPQ